MVKGSVVVGEAEGSSSEVGVVEAGQDGFADNSSDDQSNGSDLHSELWHACAGPFVYVPKAGEKVFYFPQGHIEQIEPYTNQDGTDMPIYHLPSKILCKVVCVQLKAEARTDEVFATITLLPLDEHDEQTSNDDGVSMSLPRKTKTRSFSKKLTASDTSTHGGFSVPKRYADECLPPLNMAQQPPMQKLLARDVHGTEWFFRHIYRGQPKRHLLTTGWSTFMSTKKLVAGDSFIFLRGENGELRVGIRRATRQENLASTATIISSNGMKHGILASASHAISTGTLFTVYFHPWTSSTEFIIPYDQYMKSAEIDYGIGTRFTMLFEGEDCLEQRHEGMVVGIEDVDPIRWPNSEWRTLEVKWDAPTDAFVRPDRVSPWNIEPIEPVRKKHNPLLHRAKRARALDAPSPGFSSLVRDDLLHSPGQSEVLQGQENGDTYVNELGVVKPPIQHFISPTNPEWNHAPVGLANQHYFPMHGPLYLCPSSIVSFPGGKIASMGLATGCFPSFESYGFHENAAGSRILPAPNVNPHNSGFQAWKGLELKDAKEVPLAPENGGACKLFGVNLITNPPELPSPQIATSSELESFYSVPRTCHSGISDSSKSTSGINSESQCNNCCSATNQICAKGIPDYGPKRKSLCPKKDIDKLNHKLTKSDASTSNA